MRAERTVGVEQLRVGNRFRGSALAQSGTSVLPQSARRSGGGGWPGSWLSRCGGSRRAAGVLDRDDGDSVVVGVVAVDEKHPSPRSEQHAVSSPASLELASQVGERHQRGQHRTDARSRVGWQAVGADEAIEVVDCPAGELDPRHVRADRVGSSVRPGPAASPLVRPPRRRRCRPAARRCWPDRGRPRRWRSAATSGPACPR